MIKSAFWLFGLVISLLVCFSAARAQEMMRVEPLTIVTMQASTTFSAEIADTDATRERGLMFRHIMPEGQAMLFDFGAPRPAAMWMKNTYMSLDMLFVRQDGTIAAMAENTVPKSLDTISVQEPVRGVIELAAGTVKRLGIHKNDHVVNAIFKASLN
ncbi:MAG: DUF192 domain-containing protein [Alphaproteobacteria bacterium]|nr:DUF192 domain-containing protein [Alphaproteobacteria bacterium]